MSTTKQCRTCGADVPGNAPFGHCPKCLLDLGFGLLPDESPAPGPDDNSQRFGEYELVEQLGRGGMGTVYKARQVRLNRLVALKMISAGEFASPMLIQRFRREAEAAANLHHPNIVPIYETGEMKGQCFYSMQLIDGTGLDRHISRVGFSLGHPDDDARAALRTRQDAIARILAKVVRAVDYAHQHGVLHRDLKPSNIILDPDGEPHLTDFGVAKVLGHDASNLTASGAIMGTPSYMAPEQAAGDSKRITTAADIYSLGAILYAMLTGNPPFRAETPVETLRQVIEQEPKHPSTLKEGIDADLATIAMRCLDKDPQRRYSSAAALADDLERWLRREPIQARPIQAAERLWRWCQRNPKLAALVASVAVLLIAVSIGSMAVALHIRSLNESVENNNRELRNGVVDNLSKIYSDPSTTSYTIKAQVRHALVGIDPSRQFRGVPLELTFVDYVYGDPTRILDVFSPILQTLEQDLGRQLRRPVLIHLTMLQSYNLGYDALETNEMTFGRVGPASFTHLLDKGTGVRLVVMQDHKNPLTMALFTRTNSAVAHVMEQQPNISLASLLANRSVAFGNSNSTTGSHVGRWFMAINGVFATNLARFQHLKSHTEVTNEVRSGNFDVGLVNQEMIREASDLHVVAQYPVSADLGRCWVAGRRLDTNVFMALRESLLQMRDPAIIGKIESKLDGFKVVDDRALEQLRKIMREASAFDSRKREP